MFHDIFSENKEKRTEKTKIVIDNYEKNSLVPAELIRLNFTIEFKHLQVADYMVKDIVVERKTVSDLKSSIINKRIFRQLRELKQYNNYFLIIEGNKEDLFNNEILHENAVRGFLLSLASKIKVPIIFSDSEKETAKYFQIIANKKEKEDISLNQKKIFFSEREQKQYILEGFPGIGPASAKKLLDKFKTLNNIFNASERELEIILRSKTKDFLKLLHL